MPFAIEPGDALLTYLWGGGKHTAQDVCQCPPLSHTQRGMNTYDKINVRERRCLGGKQPNPS